MKELRTALGEGAGFRRGSNALSLVNGQSARIADVAQGSADKIEIDSPRRPGLEVIESYWSPAEGRQGVRTGRIQPVVLDVDIHQVRLQPLQGVKAVGFAADQQIGGLIDQAEIGLINPRQDFEHRAYLFEQCRRVTLVGEPDSPPRRHPGGGAGKCDVLASLETDADQITAQRLGDIEARADLAQAAGAFVIVQRHVGVGGHHRHPQPLIFDLAAHVPKLAEGSLDTTGAGPHADGRVARGAGGAEQLFEWQTEPGLACRLNNSD